MAESAPEVLPDPARKKAPRKRAAKNAPTSAGSVVFAGDHLYGIKAGSRLVVDQETADFLVEHGHASLPKSKQ